MADKIVKSIKLEAKEQIKQIKTEKKAQIAAVKTQTVQKLASESVKYQRKLEKQNQRRVEAQIPKRYSVGEEIFNSVSHGVGTGLSIAALVLLIVRAVFYAPARQKGFYVTGFAIFGSTLIVLYLMSTLYHALTPYHVKKIFGIFDHSSIYLLISGTYTPFCLGVLRVSGGWWLFGAVWFLTVLGIVFYAIFGSKMRAFSAGSYLVMGWLICFFWKPLQAGVNPLCVRFLIAGGIVYTIGIIFYALKKIKWTHCVWHLFVLGGSVLHFFSVYYSL